jgi:hypothetical protein
MFVVDKLGKHAELDQLKKLDLVDVITTYYSTLPDDVSIVIKSVYISMEDEKYPHGLYYLRRWLKIDQTADVPFTHFSNDDGETYRDPKEVYNEWAVDSKEDYIKWISDNLEKLEAIHELEHKTDAEFVSYMKEDIKEGTGLYDYLTSRDWYKDNLVINECISNSLRGLDTKNKRRSLNKEMLVLCGRSGDEKYSETIESSEKDIALMDSQISFSNSLITMMKSSADPDKETTQEFFSL